ncbi:hypothetical protein SAMN05192574_101351 [Mucilaginibacter gossypiicola]|uniref:Uncharacterized protein n=1 Tax=Mucilaginibacter gossypiicola TaxID=551995 RepID=A0A1H8A479_9SPHI|nr:hypothetical protein SAMN05192574_101351 [Mucilaginibacter gossypiicola]
MPNVKCITPDCPCWISDPCVKTNALFQIRTDLLERLVQAPADKQISASINQVDSLIVSELGIQDIHAQHQLFKKSGTQRTVFHLFTLVCVLNHKNQYNISC